MYNIAPKEDVERYSNINTINPIPVDKLHLIKCVTWNLYQYSNVMHHFMDMLTADAVVYDKKTIDVFMVCHPHDNQPLLHQHRQHGLAELDKYKKKYNIVCQTDKLAPTEYFRLLRKAKVCIAPYGLGERIALDQYGILAGCIVIKPPMDHLVCDPNIYTKEHNMVETCNVDFSDLESILQRILGSYNPTYVKIAMDRKDRLVPYDKQYYADRFFRAVTDSLYEHDPIKYASYNAS
jgi:hypothetical protein